MALMYPLQQVCTKYLTEQRTSKFNLGYKRDELFNLQLIAVTSRKGKDTSVSATVKKEKNLVEPRELSGGGLLPADSTQFCLPWNWCALFTLHTTDTVREDLHPKINAEILLHRLV